jgi:hypothetical protein
MVTNTFITRQPTLAVVSALLLLSSCGARLKTASEVSGIFSKQDSMALGSVVTDLCQKVRAREQAPNMSKASLNDTECARAGENADNYKTVEKAFFFEGLTSEINKESGKDVLRLRARAKVWLNQNILDLALKLTKALKERTEGGGDIFAQPATTEGGGGLENLIKITTKELQRVEFKQSDRSFKGALNISGSGLVTINNDIEIIGQIFSDSIAVNINSTKSQEFKESILKDANIIALIKPYAGDVYVDIVFDVNIHSVGFQGLITDKINTALGSSLKTALDSLLKIK